MFGLTSGAVLEHPQISRHRLYAIFSRLSLDDHVRQQSGPAPELDRDFPSFLGLTSCDWHCICIHRSIKKPLDIDDTLHVHRDAVLLRTQHAHLHHLSRKRSHQVSLYVLWYCCSVQDVECYTGAVDVFEPAEWSTDWPQLHEPG